MYCSTENSDREIRAMNSIESDSLSHPNPKWYRNILLDFGIFLKSSKYKKPTRSSHGLFQPSIFTLNLHSSPQNLIYTNLDLRRTKYLLRGIIKTTPTNLAVTSVSHACCKQ